MNEKIHIHKIIYLGDYKFLVNDKYHLTEKEIEKCSFKMSIINYRPKFLMFLRELKLNSLLKKPLDKFIGVKICDWTPRNVRNINYDYASLYDRPIININNL